MKDKKSNPRSKYPTPMHIYWGSRAREDANTVAGGIRRNLPQARFFYSVKTNPLPALINDLHEIGWGMEVVNPGDFALARRAQPCKMVVNSIIPDESAYRSILTSLRTAALHIESLDAADVLARAARKIQSSRFGFLAPKVRARVGLRINDGNSHFGFPLNKESLNEAVKRLEAAGLVVSSLHCHTNYDGGIFTSENYEKGYGENLTRLLKAREMLAAILGRDEVMSLDLGGGVDHPELYRVPAHELGAYHSGELQPPARPQSLGEIAEAIGKSVAAKLRENNAENLEVFFEFGRAVSARALDTLLTVQLVKRDLYPSAVVVVTDGSTSLLGPVHRAIHPIETQSESQTALRTYVYGKLPHSGDWLAQNIQLPAVKPGETILIKYTGAYFLPLESRFGNSFPSIIDGVTGKILRDREKISEWTKYYRS